MIATSCWFDTPHVNQYEWQMQLDHYERTEVPANSDENDLLGYSINEDRDETATDGGTSVQDRLPDNA